MNSVKQKGFTLVEVAIAMAVIGILLGASFMPLRVLDEARQREQEEARMQKAADAVAGYAIRHRTRPRTVVFQGAGVSQISVQIPGGRPYLPCPDVNGDGFEDREPKNAATGFAQGMEINTATKLTLALQAVDSAPPGGAAKNRPQWVNPVVYGGCRASRGALPWRTLGIEPADRWGNRHTYYADPIFAGAVFGFDENSVANIYDSRAPRFVSGAPALRAGAAFNTGLSANPADQPVDFQCPAVICNGGRTNDANACLMHSTAGGCAWNPAAAANVVLKAGALANEEITDFSTEPFPAGGMLDGLPFVIVSHGPNGRGAVNHWASLTSPLGAAAAAGPICNRAQLIDAESALAAGDIVFAGDYPMDNHEAMNATRYAPGNSAGGDGRRCPPFRGAASAVDVAGVELRPWVFVWEPPGGDYAPRRYDDMLKWMTREELNLALGREDIPPLPSMVVADVRP